MFETAKLYEQRSSEINKRPDEYTQAQGETKMTPYTFKICSKFNTVEFTVDTLPEKEDLQEIYDLIASIKVKEEDMPQRAVKKAGEEKPKKPVDTRPASDAQVTAMMKLGIDFPDNVTMSQARRLLMDYNNKKWGI